MAALSTWNGGVIVISHDERFITTVAKEVSKLCRRLKRNTNSHYQLWVCADGTVAKFMGDVQAYKKRIRAQANDAGVVQAQ